MLQQQFIKTASSFTQGNDLIHALWEQIGVAYTAPYRAYHNLHHLEEMLVQLLSVQDKMAHWDEVMFALYYHDIVYHPLRGNNEAESALIAARALQQLAAREDFIARVTNYILATKSHQQTDDSDANYFTDADLAILGSSKQRYSEYVNAIRQEYAEVPDSLYIPGRAKVLQHFIDMSRIYKTDHFFLLLEDKARQNIRYELDVLSNE